MIPRRLISALTSALAEAQAVALLGVGDREALLAHPVTATPGPSRSSAVSLVALCEELSAA